MYDSLTWVLSVSEPVEIGTGTWGDLGALLYQMYFQGVSTRKVQAIFEELNGMTISSAEVSRAAQALDPILNEWRTRPIIKAYQYLIVDARYEKVRDHNCVLSTAILIVYGVSEDGSRDVLGVSAALSEAEQHWRAFFQSLVTRGLHGIKMITSDAHAGLKGAINAVFPSVPWQRCQFHLQQNAQSYVPKVDMKKEVAAGIRKIFDANSEEEAREKLRAFVHKYEKTASKLSEWAEINVGECFSVFSQPECYRQKLRTTNLAERWNREIARRTRVVSIFPNLASCERLISALLMEVSEEWSTSSRRYLPERTKALS